MEEENGKISQSRRDEPLPLQEKTIGGGSENKAARNVLFDLLRVMAMFFIVIHHIIIYDMGFMDVQTGMDLSLKTSYMWSALVDGFVIIGVNIFFLISGWFSIKLKPQKLFLLFIKVYVYWIIAVLLAMAFKLLSFESFWDGFKFCVSAIGEYWFVLVYILLCLIAPALNALAKLIVDKKAVKYFIFISVFFFCVIGFVADYIRPIMGTNSGYSVMWAAVPYLYGRILKLKCNEMKKRKPAFWLGLYLLFTIVNYSIVALLIWFEQGQYAWHFYGYNNPLVFLQSICFFMAFVSAKPVSSQKPSKFISLVAGHTFGVYLLHTKNPLFSPYTAYFVNAVGPIWAKLLLLIPNAILAFAIAVLIDYLYELLFGKLLKRFTTWLERIIFGKSKILEKLNCQPDQNDDTKKSQ
ncbi:MAG: acyltransferase family protein [Clostridia bacterium]|nr:acyltransferase family protein [Clostridia bacterium]